MLQINLFTDLFFASFIPGTAAALSYANLLVQTPLGIISNVILVPFFAGIFPPGRPHALARAEVTHSPESTLYGPDHAAPGGLIRSSGAAHCARDL